MASNIPGDIEIETLKIGEVDLSDKKVQLVDFNVYESAIHHHTFADITILDANDVLGQKQLAGDEEVEIKFKHAGASNGATFKFKLVENAKLRQGPNLRHKTYQLRCVSPEALKAQNKVVNKSWETQTSGIVKDIVKDYWESEKEIKINKETKNKQKFLGNSKRPHDVIDALKHRHVSQDHKDDGSVYTLYETRNENGEQEIHFDTFHNMMKNNTSELTFQQSPGVGSATTETSADFTNILKINVASSFHTLDRHRAPSARSTYCLASGKQQKVDEPFKDPKIPTAESPIRQKELEKINKPPKDQKPQRSRIIDPANNKDQTYMSQNDPYKSAMMARLTNDVSVMEVPGNVNLRVGQVINVKLAQKADMNKPTGDMEKQITNKVLITGLRHKVNPQGVIPRYVCVVEFIKAGFEEGVS